MANDFRNYLKGVDSLALQYTGNDGRIDPTKAGYDTKAFSTLDKGKTQSYIDNLYSQWQSSVAAAAPKPTPTYTTPAPYVPKLVNFDIMANYNKARQTAAAAVNPTYDRYMAEFLAGQNAQADIKRKDVGLTKETNALSLSQALAGNAVERTRTSEDEAAALAKLGTDEANFQQDSGTQYDADRRAAAEQGAASGLGDSMAVGTMFDANNKRNLDEGRQVKEYANQKEAKKLLSTRTMQDLERGDKDAQAIAANKDKSADFDLEAYLQDLSIEKQKFTNSNEIARMTETANQASTYEQQGKQSFLASLAGQGYNSQDIAQAYAMYG